MLENFSFEEITNLERKFRLRFGCKMFDIYCPIFTHLKKQNPLNSPFRGFLIQTVSVVVGMAGFEPTTSCSQSRRDTGLRYIPNLVSSFYFLISKGCKVTNLKWHIHLFFITFFFERWGRDSNPRYRYQYDSLANCSFRPLRHLTISTPSTCPTDLVLRSANIVKQVILQKKITKLVDNLFAHDRYSSASSWISIW